MAGLHNVIGLLYRADWTRLSLSAELRSETDRELLPRPSREEPPRWYRPRPAQTQEEKWSRWHRAWPAQKQDDGRYSWRGTLLIGPAGRWRLEGSVPGQGAGGEAAEGYDGERGWSWRSSATDGPPPLPVKVDGAYPPVPDLFCPSCLLGGYSLEELGPVTVAGRDAIAAAATPRRDVLGSKPGHQSRDRIEVAVDAELGILLRRVETSGDEVVTLTELTDLTMNPPEAADPARFTAPLGSHRGEGQKETPPHSLSEPDGKAATMIAGLAASGLGALIRYAPHLPGHGADEEYSEAAMPLPDPAPLGPGDDPPPGDLLHLLYRAGDPRDLRATVRWWHDAAVMAAWVSERARAAGQAVIGQFVDAVTPGKTVSRLDARLRVSGPDRYRLEYSYRGGRARPTTVACDGERRWRVYPDRTVTGPAAPLENPLMFLADTCWLLRARLSGGQEITYRGRRARQVRVTRVRSGGDLIVLGPLMFFPADAIVDAETGCLLRLLSYSGDRLASWWELDDISTEPGDPDDFRVHVPPGTRTVEESGNPLTDEIAAMPGLTGTAARAAAETITRTTSAVSAARTFLDDLRGRSHPPP
jgi:outer membrane lipoprotein-sorting protein